MNSLNGSYYLVRIFQGYFKRKFVIWAYSSKDVQNIMKAYNNIDYDFFRYNKIFGNIDFNEVLSDFDDEMSQSFYFDSYEQHFNESERKIKEDQEDERILFRIQDNSI